jgi:putative membrane protein
MINYNPKNWLSFIFSFHKSDTARMMWKELIYIGLLTALIAFLEIHFFPNATYLKNLTTVYSLLGFIISLLLVFRTNTAYDRWWEGRKMWGSMVNDSRNFISKLCVLELTSNERDYFERYFPLFTVCAKEHLRGQRLIAPEFMSPEDRTSFEKATHQALWVVLSLRGKLQDLRARGIMDSIELSMLNQNLDRLVDSLGACERIRNTPIPFSYSLFIKKFIFIYVITMPLAFVELFGYYSAFISTFVFYALVSMELLAEEIEDPFGKDENDLPTDALSETIQRNTSELLQNKKSA